MNLFLTKLILFNFFFLHSGQSLQMEVVYTTRKLACPNVFPKNLKGGQYNIPQENWQVNAVHMMLKEKDQKVFQRCE